MKLWIEIITLDIKNPHQEMQEQIDPNELLAEYEVLEKKVLQLRNALKAELTESLSETTHELHSK